MARTAPVLSFPVQAAGAPAVPPPGLPRSGQAHRDVVASRPPMWLYAVVIIGALGVLSLAYGALFSPATILGSGQQMTASARTWAHYAVTYDVALGVALLVPLAVRAWRVLAGTLVQAAFAEALLGIVGIINHRPEQVAADVILIAAFVLCARRLYRTAGPAGGR